MAHECPECGLTCHCGGDIDDINFGESDEGCMHCLHKHDEEVTDEMIQWSMEGYTKEDYESEAKCCDYIMKHKISPNLDFPEQ